MRPRRGAPSNAGAAAFCYDAPTDADALRKYLVLACGVPAPDAGVDGGP